jgi:hypothetical protein
MHHTKRTPVSRWNNAVIHTIVEPSESGPKETGVFANVFAEGVYKRIDLELGKTHDEYEKQINEYIKF